MDATSRIMLLRLVPARSAVCILLLVSSAPAAVVFSGYVDPVVPTMWNSSTDGYISTPDGPTGSAVRGWRKHVASKCGYLGCGLSWDYPSSGTATISGPGSKWTNSSDLFVGYNIAVRGTLNVASGGLVSKCDGLRGVLPGIPSAR